MGGVGGSGGKGVRKAILGESERWGSEGGWVGGGQVEGGDGDKTVMREKGREGGRGSPVWNVDEWTRTESSADHDMRAASISNGWSERWT